MTGLAAVEMEKDRLKTHLVLLLFSLFFGGNGARFVFLFFPSLFFGGNVARSSCLELEGFDPKPNPKWRIHHSKSGV